ncbi:hypothetical protein L1285_17255 [Pseudoalteromonas sp. DL2-H2.2]|uniref:hypothetical protein n=1 Tax=Pseudoalteromonas sp. DL2-H2.2 TaxID=2908889 RepID=UPI001F4849A8|nr:hypothetical protein [Pseudoalteromonas sp. DL2-H2.2]MCF2910064.1 hypothetical protein [Pseudoalteromonas sp. DL2-H2.2]
MQVTSNPYQVNNAYQKPAKTPQSTDYIQQQSEQQSEQVNAPNNGFDVRGQVNLVYLLKPEDITKLSDEPNFLADFDITLRSPEELEQQYTQKGLQRDVGTIIFVEGKAVASQGYDGTIYGQGPVADIFNQAGQDPEKIKQLVAQHFPDARVEFYAEGKGPTNAEVFELRYGETYEDFVREQVQSHSDHYLTDQINAEENYRRKLMFEQTPQTSVFSVDGRVVASRDEKGFVDVGQPLLAEADARGIERETLKELFRYSPERSPEDYQALLNQVFGDGVELHNYDATAAPTRAEVRELAETG